MSAARDKLLHLMVPNNRASRMRAQQLDLIEQSDAELELTQSADINGGDIGTINAGTIVTGNGLPLGAGFTGMIRFSVPLEWPVGSGLYWTDIAFENDVMTFGVSATDGALYALGGDYYLSSGRELVSTGIPREQVAQLNLGSNHSQMGILVYNPIASAGLTYAPESVGVSLVAEDVPNPDENNGNFETGDLTGWTDSVTGDGAVSVSTTYARYGKYACALTAKTGTASILSDVFGVGDYGITLSFNAWNKSHNSTWVTVSVEWYNVSNTLLHTDTITPVMLYSSSLRSWYRYVQPLQTPSTAVNCKIKFAVTGGGVFTESFIVDNVTVAHRTYTNFTDRARFLGLRRTNDVMDGPLYIEEQQESRLHYGDQAGYSLAPDNTSENTVYSRIIKANALGASGFVRVKVVIHATNTVDATNYTVTPRIKWGGSTVFSPGTLTFSANTQRHSVATYEFTITNVGATGSQELTLDEIRFTNHTQAASSGGVTPTPLLYETTASVDTTADATLAVTIQKSSADTDLDVKVLVIKEDGPIYKA